MTSLTSILSNDQLSSFCWPFGFRAAAAFVGVVVVVVISKNKHSFVFFSLQWPCTNFLQLQTASIQTNERTHTTMCEIVLSYHIYGQIDSKSMCVYGMSMCNIFGDINVARIKQFWLQHTSEEQEKWTEEAGKREIDRDAKWLKYQTEMNGNSWS